MSGCSALSKAETSPSRNPTHRECPGSRTGVRIPRLDQFSMVRRVRPKRSATSAFERRRPMSRFRSFAGVPDSARETACKISRRCVIGRSAQSRSCPSKLANNTSRRWAGNLFIASPLSPEVIERRGQGNSRCPEMLPVPPRPELARYALHVFGIRGRSGVQAARCVEVKARSRRKVQLATCRRTGECAEEESPDCCQAVVSDSFSWGLFNGPEKTSQTYQGLTLKIGLFGDNLWRGQAKYCHSGAKFFARFFLGKYFLSQLSESFFFSFNC